MNIPLEDYFEQYENDEPFDCIFGLIAKFYESATAEVPDYGMDIKDFGKMKSKICYKLINTEKNQELLEEVPHRSYYDLSIVYYILVARDDEVMASSLIRNELMDLWGVDEDVLYSLAQHNTPLKLQGDIIPMSSILKRITGGGEEDSVGDGMDQFYVVSNKYCQQGAVVMLYEGIREKFAKKSEDFFILPSSVHETLFVPACHGMEAGELLQTVQEVNLTSVLPEEFLSDNIYYYSGRTNSMQMICGYWDNNISFYKKKSCLV